MNKLYYAIAVIILSIVTMFAFSGCGDKKENDPSVTLATIPATTSTTELQEEYETVYVVVTNAEGENVTDSDGNDVTEVSKKVKKTKTEKTKKTTTTTYVVKGGTDPYVEDIF